MNRNNLTIMLPVLGKLLYTYPDEGFLCKIREARLFDDMPYISGQNGFTEAVELMRGWQDTGDDSAVISDYQDLFVGIRGRVKVPAWESVYVAPEPVMFGGCTLDVRRWYDRHGIQIKNIRREPDDHIGLELMFLARLMEIDPAEAEEFFTKHIAPWYGKFFKMMEQYATTGFYRGLALMIRCVCEDVEESVKVNM
jgi:TorA maturation chaperone TorD